MMVERVVWPGWAIEEILKLWERGLSAGDIAIELGTRGFKTTRNAVIGKLHRMGKTKADQNGGRSKPARVQTRKPKPAPYAGAPKARSTPFRANAKPTPAPAVETIPEGPGIPWIEAADDACKWPTNENPPMVCGAKAIKGKPYCEHHASIGRQVAKPRVKVAFMDNGKPFSTTTRKHSRWSR